MGTLNHLDTVTIHTLTNYVNGTSRTLAPEEILKLSYYLSNDKKQLDTYLIRLEKHLYSNNVNTMVFLSDLEWSYFVIEGLWGLFEKVNKQKSYNFTSSETLVLTTRILVDSVEKISTLPLRSKLTLDPSFTDLESLINEIFITESLFKFDN
jgi:hypothetical protein